jgi:hypothetical protein
MNLHCIPVTSLFEINRESFDGRSMEQYKTWLRQTITLFPSLVVFHDGCIDELEFPDVLLVEVDKSQLEIFKLKSQVEMLLRSGFGNTRDITFRIADYSLIQYAKFEFLSRAIQITEAKSALWIDAGISRFFSQIKMVAVLESSSMRLIDLDFQAVFEVDIRNNLSLSPLGISRSLPGTCHRVFSGTSFWVNGDSCKKLQELVFEEAKKWLNLNKWDNEQVMLRNLLPLTDIKVLYVPQKKETGTVARHFEKFGSIKSRFLSELIKKNLL